MNITLSDLLHLAVRVIGGTIFIVLLIILLGLALDPAAGAWCSLRPQSIADKDDGKEWRWTMLEGRKCWYRAERRLPKSDLLWEYSREEFDEGGIVRERKYLTPPQNQEE